MPHCRFFLTLFFIAPLSSSAYAQTMATAPKNPSALRVLAQMSAVTGWGKTNAPTDVLATGTVTVPDDTNGASSSNSITLRARGSDQFSFESGQSASNRSVASLGRATATIGSKQIYLPGRVFNAWHFPFLSSLVSFADPTIRVEYLGMEQLSEATYKIRLSREPSSSDPTKDEVQAGSPVTVWVSSSSFLPIQVEYKKATLTNRLAFIPRTVKYSDFRRVGNLLVPFKQEEWYEGELIYSLQLSNVRFDNGFSDADFAIH